jgi:histidyl-tRNA synthetase
VSEGPTKAPEKPRKFQAIKGVRDLLPPETALWSRVEQAAREVFGTFGFCEIRLPIIELTELFARAVGAETDVVSKEMYSFEDHDFPELARLRTLLSSEVLHFGDPRQFQNFDARARGFAEELNQQIIKQLIGRTPENELLLKSLPQLLVESAYYQRELASSQRPDSTKAEHRHRLGRSLEQIRKLLREVVLGDEIALRPEATASVCRAYIEHNMQQLPQPVKLYYMGPMFRRERPQKGRYRQFYQIGAEALGGSDAPAIDAEVIDMLMTFFDKIGLQGATLYINSIGHSADNCRRAYVELLRTELQKVKDKLGADSQRRIDTNPLRVLDSKLEHEQPIIEKLPRIADHLCPDCAANFAAVKRELQLRGIIYKENWRLVRGLDYYMRTTFEITAQGLGSQNAVCGGGRYDGLVELLGGPPTKGIGFAIGEDRLILSLQESAKASEASTDSPLVYPEREGRGTRHSPLVFIAWMGQHAYAAAVRAAKDLRNAGFSVELPPTELKFGKALGQADKLGAKYALILGDNEVAEGLWTLKKLADGTQTKLPEPALIDHLRDARKLSS